MKTCGKCHWLALITYFIYIVAWESFVWVGCAYVVFWLGRSGWWFALALLLSGAAYGPERWATLIGGEWKEKTDDT